MSRLARYPFAIALCAATTLLVPDSSASSDSHPKQSGSAVMGADRSSDAYEAKWEHDPVVFTARDREAILNYYRDAPSDLPPGLAKRNGDLPPGLRKQLRRNGTLPPGLQKRVEPLSGDLERRLHPLESGYSRGMIGQDAVIVEIRTRRILDIIRDVTGGR